MFLRAGRPRRLPQPPPPAPAAAAPARRMHRRGRPQISGRQFVRAFGALAALPLAAQPRRGRIGMVLARRRSRAVVSARRAKVMGLRRRLAHPDRSRRRRDLAVRQALGLRAPAQTLGGRQRPRRRAARLGALGACQHRVPAGFAVVRRGNVCAARRLRPRLQYHTRSPRPARIPAPQMTPKTGFAPGFGGDSALSMTAS